MCDGSGYDENEEEDDENDDESLSSVTAVLGAEVKLQKFRLCCSTEYLL